MVNKVALATVLILTLGERTALLLVYFGPLLYVVFRHYGMPSLFTRRSVVSK